MIGHDENQEEVSFKVTDRRKFNPDGSVREGIELHPGTEENVSAAINAAANEAVSPPDSAATDAGSTADPRFAATNQETEKIDEDVPGADDPASFVNFLSTLATNAAAALGAIPHPATGQRSLDLETGKYWLDVLGMIREKTNGNLHPQETRLIDTLLADLRMQYVTMIRATEDKLKAQAARKFSGADILGKK